MTIAERAASRTGTDRTSTDVATPTAPDGPDPRVTRVREVQAWLDDPRFEHITRLHGAADVIDQEGSIAQDHTVAREAAVGLYRRLRERFAAGAAITTFGPYTPGQAVTMKRQGIEAIYLGGWATSAKGSLHEDPGPDLASYPLSAVPDEAAGIVRALLTADRNQSFERSRQSAEQRAATAPVDFSPWIIADADTGHGGDAHVRNLIRRFVEVGVPGYHIEDQRPGAKKCGHQDGKVLVAQAEQNKRLNAARLQLDVMGVPGIIVARTDAEAATLLDDIGDERDQPFVLGATARDLPPFRVALVALLRRLHAGGLTDVRGHLLYGIPTATLDAADAWLTEAGLGQVIEDGLRRGLAGEATTADVVDGLDHALVAAWAARAGLATLAEAMEQAIATADPAPDPAGVARWRSVAGRASIAEARSAAAELGIDLRWDPELPRTPDGFYRVRGGIDYAIAKSLAAAPFADLLWMETKTADLADARRFAEAIHAVYPEQMLAYNLSPSFNWDTTGMSDEAMRRFQDELGRLGFVFTFITYGGHQVDGMATESFARELRRDGMLALARLQRRLRLLESPYRTPQALVGGERLDAALLAASGRTAATKAMGAGSTHKQHLVGIEPAPRVLAERLADWATAAGVPTPVRVRLEPAGAWSETLHLAVEDAAGTPLARLLATPVRDGDGATVLVVAERWTAAGLDAEAVQGPAVAYLVERTRAGRVVDLDSVRGQRSERTPVA